MQCRLQLFFTFYFFTSTMNNWAALCTVLSVMAKINTYFGSPQSTHQKPICPRPVQQDQGSLMIIDYTWLEIRGAIAPLFLGFALQSLLSHIKSVTYSRTYVHTDISNYRVRCRKRSKGSLVLKIMNWSKQNRIWCNYFYNHLSNICWENNERMCHLLNSLCLIFSEYV